MQTIFSYHTYLSCSRENVHLSEWQSIFSFSGTPLMSMYDVDIKSILPQRNHILRKKKQFFEGDF